MSATAVVCPNCAKTLRSARPLAVGVAVKCPGCKHAFTVPDPDDEIVEVDFADDEPPSERRVSTGLRGAENLRSGYRRVDDDEPEVRSKRRRSDDDFEEDDEPPRKRRILADVEDDLDESEPLPRKPRKKKRKKKQASSSGFGSSGAGILGGLAMMGIAVVWFVVGLMNDYIFFYPPILFIIGIVAIIKGAASE